MKIGLVLSGGLAKGAFQIGALRAISEYFKPEDIEYISSSSVGALNAYAFSSDNLDVGARMWEDLTPGDEKILVTKVMKSDYLKGCTLGLAQKHVLSKKQYVSVFRLKKMDVLYVDVGHKEPDEAALYLQAAVAMPVFSSAVKINRKKYYDGGTIDNIPVFPLLRHKLDYIICVYFDEYFSFEKTEIDDKIIKITFGPDEKEKAKSIWFTKEGTERMMEEGYERAKAVLDRVFADGVDNLPKIYEHIKEIDGEHPERKLRVTVDVAIGCLNKMAKFISKRKIID